MKNRFVCIIIAIMLYHGALPVYSQATWYQYNGPFSGEIGSLARYNDTLFIGSTLTGIFKSHDGGKNWTPAVPSITYVHSLFDNDTSLLIGSNKLYSYTDSTSDLIQLGQEVPGAISYIHKMNGKLFVSTDQSVYRYEPETNLLVEVNNGLPTFQNGVRWTRDLTSIDGILFCNVLADGLYKSVDEGENWEKVAAPSFDYSYLSMHARNDSLVYVGEWHVYVSTDKGESLSEITYDLPSAIYMSSVIIGNQIFLTTDKGFFRLDKASSHWVKLGDATTYRTIMLDEETMFTSDEDGFYKWESNEFIPANKGINTSRVRDIEVFRHKIYSGTHSGLHYTTPGSDDWQVVPELRNHFVNAIAKSGSKLFVATGKGLYVASGSTLVFNKVEGIPPGYVMDIEVLNNSIFAATEYDVYVSYNEGVTWQVLHNSVSTAPDAYITHLGVSDNMLVAGNTKGLCRILPDSSDWEKIDFFTTQTSSLNIINGIIYASAMNTGIYRSPDYGVTWEHLTIDAPNTLDMLKRGNNIYAASYNKIYYSDDNGLTWDPFYETGIPSVMINCIAQGENAFYMGTYGKSIWYRYFMHKNDIESDVYTIENDTIYDIDPNVTLSEFQENVSVSYGASIELEIINEAGRASGNADYVGVNRVKIIAEDGTTKRILNVKGAPGVVTGVSEIEKIKIKLYPNPTPDKLFIEHVELLASWQIINGMGQKQPQPELRDGYIDVSHLPSGIYFLKVSDQTRTYQTLKFLKN